MPAQNIVAIPAVGAVSNTTITHTDLTSLSTGTIAGIVVGDVIAIILLIALGLYYFRFRRMADGPAIELESAQKSVCLGCLSEKSSCLRKDTRCKVQPFIMGWP